MQVSDVVRGGLPDLLRAARHQHRLSQLELSYELQISARHLGFVEVGRSVPSRALLLRWLARLGVPFGIRNEALQMAGYAPAFEDGALDSAPFAEARKALIQLLTAQDPFPAIILDAEWRIVASNTGFRWLIEVCGGQVAVPQLDDVALTTDRGPTLTDLVLGPHGIGHAVLNLLEVGPAYLAHLRQDALTNPQLATQISQLEQALPGQTSAPASFPPSMIVRYATAHGELAFMTMLTTFGTPQSITLSSLRVELMFPADQHTRSTVSRR
jgi:transcriptional regulator with XRE-family HTH domain